MFTLSFMAVDARPVVDAKKTFFLLCNGCIGKKARVFAVPGKCFQHFFAAASTAQKKKSFLTLTPVQVSML